MTFYKLIVCYCRLTIALSCTIFELSDVRNIMTLNCRSGVTRGHWK